MIELNYAINTIFFLISGAMVMWMAAGFTALEAGSVRTKNVTGNLNKERRTIFSSIYRIFVSGIQTNVWVE